MSRNRELNAYLLCGGASRRMGTDKALLPHPDGGTLLEHAAALVAAFAGRLSLLSGEGPRYPVMKLPELPDSPPGSGPLGGIAAALADSDERPALILPVDLPYLGVIPLQRMRDAFFASAPALAVAAGPDGLHPVLGIWGGSCRAPVEAALAAGRWRLQDLFCELDVLPVPTPALALRNWNRPDDRDLADR